MSCCDNLDRLTTVTYPDTSTVIFTCDEEGNRTRMVDSAGVSSYVYDELGRMNEYTDPQGNVNGYGYDANGNRIHLVYPAVKSSRITLMISIA